jgi:chromosome segregation ATPase
LVYFLRMEQLIRLITEMKESLEREIHTLAIRLDTIDTRLDRIDVRLDTIDTRLDRMEYQFVGFNQALTSALQNDTRLATTQAAQQKAIDALAIALGQLTMRVAKLEERT